MLLVRRYAKEVLPETQVTMIEGGLLSLTQGIIQPVTSKASWLWINSIDRFVNENGGIYDIEAYLFKKNSITLASGKLVPSAPAMQPKFREDLIKAIKDGRLAEFIYEAARQEEEWIRRHSGLAPPDALIELHRGKKINPVTLKLEDLTKEDKTVLRQLVVLTNRAFFNKYNEVKFNLIKKLHLLRRPPFIQKIQLLLFMTGDSFYLVSGKLRYLNLMVFLQMNFLDSSLLDVCLLRKKFL